MASFLYRLGSFAARKHWTVISVWVVLLVGLNVVAGMLGNKTVTEMSIPNSQANRAFTMLTERFSGINDAAAKVIFEAPNGGSIENFKPQIESTISALEKVRGVTNVQDPYAAGNDAAISTDGSMAYASVSFNVEVVSAELARQITTTASEAAGSTLSLAYVGIPDPPEAVNATDALGIALSFLILLITFGSFLAAGMPPITALLGVGLSLSAITVLSNVMTLNSTTSALATMLGLAVGIDYALFIVSRHRSNLIAGMSVVQSIAVANATAGSAVLFAGVTVIIALLGLFVVGIPFLGMMGLGAAIGVGLAVSISVTLVPAVLGLFGKKLIPRKKSRAYRREADSSKVTFGARWAQLITAKPLVTVLISVAGLLVLASPLTSMRLTLTDAGYDAPGSITRTGYDALAQGWGAGTNGPLLIVADISKTNVADITTVLDELGGYFTGIKDIKSVSAAYPNPTLDLAIVSITPDSGPSSQSTVNLVNSLREKAPAFEKKYGFTYQVTGGTAMGIDLSNLLADAILPFGLVVIGLSVLLLMIVFRSIAVPVSATLGYVLSLSAALGVTVAVFQWGWGANLLAVTKVGPLFCAMPILVMAVLFGLAMDYEVFLVSRIRERFIATGDPKKAVTSGFTKAARVVTAAAIIMFSVFIFFVPGSVASMQSIALALAVGVALDALVIRMTLIPALMTLLGKWGWALPASWQRALPVVDIEGEAVHGRLATLEWQQQRGKTVSIDAVAVTVAGTQLEPFTATIKSGDHVLVNVPTARDAQLVLAALTGRASATGLLVSCGRPLPYDGAYVRKVTSLVISGAIATEGNVSALLRELLRLNFVKATTEQVEALTGSVRELGSWLGIQVGELDATRDSESLSPEESWLIDLCVAVVSKPEILAISAFQHDASVIEKLSKYLARQAEGITTLIAVPQEVVLSETLQFSVLPRQEVNA
jgi:RND superfamily putative drug exporter